MDLYPAIINSKLSRCEHLMHSIQASAALLNSQGEVSYWAVYRIERNGFATQ